MFLDFQQKRKIKSFFYSKPILFILVCFCIFSIIASFKVYLKMVKSREDYKKSENNMIVLEQKKSELLNRIENIKTDSGVEREIRNKFSVARQDEKVVVIVPEEENGQNLPQNKPNFWQKIKDFFNF